MDEDPDEADEVLEVDEWMTLDELREFHVLHHGFPGTEPTPLREGEAAAMEGRETEIVRTALDRRLSGEERIWRREDYPGGMPPIFG